MEYCDVDGCVRVSACVVVAHGRRAKLCNNHSQGVLSALNAVKVSGKRVQHATA